MSNHSLSFVLGTPPSVRSPKVREDQIARAPEPDERRECQPSLLFGQEAEDTRRWDNTSIEAKGRAKDTRAFSWSAEDDAKPVGGGRHVFEERGEEYRCKEDRLR